MRLTPPSHSAQLERLQWIRAAAAVWESPADCRAARIWAGVGVTPISPVTALGLSNFYRVLRFSYFRASAKIFPLLSVHAFSYTA